MPSYSIMIVDDHPIMRYGLRRRRQSTENTWNRKNKQKLNWGNLRRDRRRATVVSRKNENGKKNREEEEE